jgi:hypothetical protein
MWTQITTIYQLQKLRENAEIMFRPGTPEPISMHPGNDYPDLYRLKRFDGDTIILYQSGKTNGNPFYASSGYKVQEMLNGKWWIWQN